MKDLGGFALLNLQRPSHCFLGSFLVAYELDAAVIKDGHPTASDVKIVASLGSPVESDAWLITSLSWWASLRVEVGGRKDAAEWRVKPPAMSTVRRRMQINDLGLGAQPYPRGGELEGG